MMSYWWQIVRLAIEINGRLASYVSLGIWKGMYKVMRVTMQINPYSSVVNDCNLTLRNYLGGLEIGETHRFAGLT